MNQTYATFHLHHWPNGGCPIKYYVIEYKEETQPSWRVVSNNIRSEEENIVISNLTPGTWYSVQLTAHNEAGSRVIASKFSTLTMQGNALLPRIDKASVNSKTPLVDGSVALPMISVILITSTFLLVGVLLFRRIRSVKEYLSSKTRNLKFAI